MIFFVPLLVMIVCYSRMIYVLRSQIIGSKNESDTANKNRDRVMLAAQANILKTMVLVAITFVLCWGPNQIAYLLYNVGVKINPYTWYYQLTKVLMNVNCCINPIIYTWKYRDFKMYLKKFLRLHTLRSISTSRSQMGSSVASSKATIDTSTSGIGTSEVSCKTISNEKQ